LFETQHKKIETLKKQVKPSQQILCSPEQNPTTPNTEKETKLPNLHQATASHTNKRSYTPTTPHPQALMDLTVAGFPPHKQNPPKNQKPRNTTFNKKHYFQLILKSKNSETLLPNEILTKHNIETNDSIITSKLIYNKLQLTIKTIDDANTFLNQI